MKVWSNAKLFNPPSHSISQWATAMSCLTSNLVKSMPRPAPPSPASRSANQINLAVCDHILETLMTDPGLRSCAEPFLEISARTASDTYRPMDLSELKRRLAAGRYTTASQFAADFRLMISETYRFCIDKDPLIGQAQELQHRFETAFAKRVQFTEEDLYPEPEENLNSIGEEVKSCQSLVLAF